MSVKHLVYVFENTELKGADRLMMLAIADYCDEQGSCYPSYRRLAMKCNVARRTAVKTCNRLVASGDLAIVKFAGIETKQGNTNRFYMLKWREEVGLNNDHLIMKPAEDEHTTGDADNTGDVDNTPTGDADNTPTGDVHDTLTVEDNRRLSVDMPPDKSEGVQPKEQTFITSRLFSDVALGVLSPEIFNMSAEDIIASKNYVAFGMVNGARDAYKAINPGVSATTLIADLRGFIRYWRGMYDNAVFPRNRDKFNLHLMTYLQTKRTNSTTAGAEVKPTDNELIMKAQIALGYETLDPNNINDEVKAKVEELKVMQ